MSSKFTVEVALPGWKTQRSCIELCTTYLHQKAHVPPSRSHRAQGFDQQICLSCSFFRVIRQVGALHDTSLYTRVSSTVMLCGLQWTRGLETGLRGYFVCSVLSHHISHAHITCCTYSVERDESMNSRLKGLSRGRFCEGQVGVSSGSVGICAAWS